MPGEAAQCVSADGGVEAEVYAGVLLSDQHLDVHTHTHTHTRTHARTHTHTSINNAFAEARHPALISRCWLAHEPSQGISMYLNVSEHIKIIIY